jgi:hypothetical protein
LNPYSPCVANRMVNGKQQSIWHVDDCFISHLDEGWMTSSLMNSVWKHLWRWFWKDESTKGKVVEYLGMTLDFNYCGQCSVTMIDYVKECIKPLIRMRRMIARRSRRARTQQSLLSIPTARNFPRPGASSTVW